MQQFDKILRLSTKAIQPEFFRLPVHGAAAVYRERVYCYELYHQLRKCWPKSHPCRLNGEIDKTNHPYFGANSYPIPDFIVHEPGTGGHNYAVMEVKSSDAEHDDIEKDVDKLRQFLHFQYERAIYLIFGHQAEDAYQRVLEIIDEHDPNEQRIEVWLHHAAHLPAVPAEQDAN